MPTFRKRKKLLIRRQGNTCYFRFFVPLIVDIRPMHEPLQIRIHVILDDQIPGGEDDYIVIAKVDIALDICLETKD